MSIDDQYLVAALSFGLGVILFIAAPRLIAITGDDAYVAIEIKLLRAALVAFMVFQVLDVILHNTMESYYDRLMLKISGSILVLVLGVLAFNYATRLFQQRFGTSQSFDGKQMTATSYNSRMASLIFLCFLLIFAGYALIEIWDMDSVVQRTGFVGIVAAVVAFTAPIWMPELLHGLLLLQSSMTEEGHTVTFSSGSHLYIIDRLTPFSVVLLDVDGNHRVIMKNSELMNQRIANLTMRASVEGVREHLEFSVRYPDLRKDEGAVAAMFKQLDKAVEDAFARAATDDHIMINRSVPFTWALVKSDDYALRFRFFYHLAPLPETKLTAKIRAHIEGTKIRLQRILYEEASAHGLDFASPALLAIAQPKGLRSADAGQGAESQAGTPPAMSGRK